MALVVKEYVTGDASKIPWREGDDMIDGADEVIDEGFTLYLGSHPVAAIGLILTSVGLGTLWAVTSDAVRGHGLRYTRLCSGIIDNWMTAHNLHRVQCLIRADKEEYSRWAIRLGLTFESRMEQITPDRKDMFLFKRIT